MANLNIILEALRLRVREDIAFDIESKLVAVREMNENAHKEAAQEEGSKDPITQACFIYADLVLNKALRAPISDIDERIDTTRKYLKGLVVNLRVDGIPEPLQAKVELKDADFDEVEAPIPALVTKIRAALRQGGQSDLPGFH